MVLNNLMAKMITKKRSVDDFLEEYWPVRFKWNPNCGPDEEERYRTFMESKFSREILSELKLKREEYNEILSRRFSENILSKKKHLEFMDFVYKTGLYEHVSPYDNFKSRETLRILLNYFDTFEEPFTLADLGCGHGKIALGLLLYSDKVKKAYGIDILPSAIQVSDLELSRISEENQKDLDGRIEFIEGDYHSEELLEEFKKHEPNGADIVLAAYPQTYLNFLLPAMKNYTNKNGRLITVFPEDISEIHDAPSPSEFLKGMEEIVLNYYRERGNEHGLDFNLVELVPLYNEAIVVFEGSINY